MQTIEKIKQIISQLQMDYMLYFEKSGICDYELNYLNNLEKEQWDELGFTSTTLFQYLYNVYVSEYEKLKT